MKTQTVTIDRTELEELESNYDLAKKMIEDIKENSPVIQLKHDGKINLCSITEGYNSNPTYPTRVLGRFASTELNEIVLANNRILNRIDEAWSKLNHLSTEFVKEKYADNVKEKVYIPAIEDGGVKMSRKEHFIAFVLGK